MLKTKYTNFERLIYLCANIDNTEESRDWGNSDTLQREIGIINRKERHTK